MNYFIKKSTKVEAIQFNGNSNKKEIEEFIGKSTPIQAELTSESAYIVGKFPPLFYLVIETRNSKVKANAGDWIVKETYPTGEVFIDVYKQSEIELFFHIE